MRKVKSFSVDTDTDTDIIDKLESVTNVSQYIKELIRRDIQSGPESLSAEQKEEVLQLIENFIKNQGIQIIEQENELDQDAADALDQFEF